MKRKITLIILSFLIVFVLFTHGSWIKTTEAGCSCPGGDCDRCTCSGTGNSTSCTGSATGGITWDNSSGCTQFCRDNNCSGGGNTSQCGSGGGGSPTATPVPTATTVPTPTCAPYTLKTGAIEPLYVLPGDDILVRCGYGFDSDCVGITGGGLTSCSVRTYVNGETVFACHAGTNAGVYTDVKCTTKVSTTNKCCVARQDPLPAYTVMSTSAHFEQRMRVPAGAYILSTRYNTVIYKGQGAFVDLLCASDDCGGGKKMNNSLGSIPLAANTGFQIASIPITIPSAGNNKDYKVRVVVGDGSESYIDKVSFAGGGTEYVLNNDFKNARPDVTSVTLDQPTGWGEASNKIGYYYGMAINTKIPGVPQPTGGAVTGSPPNPTGTIPGATGIKLNMKIKTQGVVTKPRDKNISSITVKMKVGGKLLPAPTAYQSVTFTPGDDGVWTGSANVTLPPGPGYSLFMKGPKHLQKKICEASPTEPSGGRYHCGDGSITLQAGDNTIDMSKILLLVGDLPENGVQNGIVDSYDTSYVRQHLQSTKPEELAIGDLNYDGVIDGQDFSLVIASLSIKYDEE